MNFLIYTYWFSNDSLNVTKIDKIKYSINQLTLCQHILTKKCEKNNNKKSVDFTRKSCYNCLCVTGEDMQGC